MILMLKRIEANLNKKIMEIQMVEIVGLLRQDHIEIDNSNAQVEKVLKCQRNINYCPKTCIKIDKRDEIFCSLRET